MTKMAKPSTTSQSCHQLISYPTSVINIVHHYMINKIPLQWTTSTFCLSDMVNCFAVSAHSTWDNKFKTDMFQNMARLNSRVWNRHNVFLRAIFLFQKIENESMNHSNSEHIDMLGRFPEKSILKFWPIVFWNALSRANNFGIKMLDIQKWITIKRIQRCRTTPTHGFAAKV